MKHNLPTEDFELTIKCINPKHERNATASERMLRNLLNDGWIIEERNTYDSLDPTYFLFKCPLCEQTIQNFIR